MTFFLYVLFYILLVIIGICIGVLWEQSMSYRYAEHHVMNSDDFCYNHCKIFEEVDSQFKDPDDVLKELDYGDHCVDCPIYLAQDIITDKALSKFVNKKNSTNKNKKKA